MIELKKTEAMPLSSIQIIACRAFQLGESTTLPVLIGGTLFSREALQEALRGLSTTHVLVLTTDRGLSLSEQTLLYMLDALDGEVSLVYADYAIEGRIVHTPEPERHIVRDTWDWGPAVLCRTADARDVCKELVETAHGALYGLCLGLQRRGRVEHAPLPVGVLESAPAESDVGERQFDYVRRQASERQADLEKVFTQHLRLLGALAATHREDVAPGSVGVDGAVASVVIPVRNRAKTIADAVHSALEQRTNFAYNIIVVDNHSTDGTSEILSSLSASDPRVLHVIPTAEDLGIGGCWNVALSDERCGQWAVQLDSDDLYSSATTLQTMVDRLRTTGSALVVGSYRLVDMELKELPPGLIDHREWTEANGPNNILRVNGMGAPRAFNRDWLRANPLPNVSYGEDYSAVLRATRDHRVERIYECLYLCRRWAGNSDANLSAEAEARHNEYKDHLRSEEIDARMMEQETRSQEHFT